jgi:sortase B
MKNGTMFAGLESYEDEEFYKAHPTIHFDTLYEQREYEIIAVFKSQIYRKSDTVFKHYNFLNAEDAAAYDEYIANIKALSLYDTGVTAAYRDELITLATCAYHTENGQFVVVAKRISG